jgi:hypothetical protein
LPALKRCDESEAFHGALNRSFPRINAGAPTRRRGTLGVTNEELRRCGGLEREDAGFGR